MSKSVSNNVFKKKSGIENIQAYLESGRSITPLEALSNFGIFRLATAIDTLRKRGLNIETEMKKDPNGKTYARYVLGAPVETAETPAKLEREFQVGDRVEFISHRSGKSYGIGTVVSINHLIDCYPFEVELPGEDVWSCRADELTLLPAEAPKKELKVGARVRSRLSLEEALGTVISIDSYGWPVRVALDNLDGDVGRFDAHELEVI
jgi:hypothetical protein